MTMTEDVAAAIALVGQGAPGIITSFNPPPLNIESAQLPALYAFTGEARREKVLGVNFVLVRRIYRVQVAAIATGQGNPKNREAMIRPLLDNVVNHYLKYPRLGNLDYVRASDVLSDSGIRILPEWGFKFMGFEIRLEVTTVEPKVLNKGE